MFLVNKTNRRTEFQIYWYYDSTCFGQPFRPSSGVLSRTLALVHFIQLWWPFATRSILLLVANGSSQLHKMYQCWCMAKNSWWRAERLPETRRVIIPINLEFSASVGFIHKDFVTLHGHTILKLNWYIGKYVEGSGCFLLMYIPVKITVPDIQPLTTFLLNRKQEASCLKCKILS